MNSEEIKLRALEKFYSEGSLSQREFCARLKLTSPENSDEWKLLNDAESLYEMAEALGNTTNRGHKTRNRASYRFKKAWALRKKRLDAQKGES